VGIDIAKDNHHAFFGTARGQALWRRLMFTNDLTGFRRLVERGIKTKARVKGRENAGHRLDHAEKVKDYKMFPIFRQ
jgi:transposase